MCMATRQWQWLCIVLVRQGVRHRRDEPSLEMPRCCSSVSSASLAARGRLKSPYLRERLLEGGMIWLGLLAAGLWVFWLASYFTYSWPHTHPVRGDTLS